MGATETSPEQTGRDGAQPIPVFDLKIEQADLDAVEAVLRSGWLTMGPRTQEFEHAFADLLGARHAVAVSSCTAALHLAYLAAGVGPGDEVIVPSYTMAATAAAVIHAGGTPVFADIISLENPSIDPARVEALITPRTRAVTVVHFGGYAAPVDEIATLCAERGLTLIEDSAHAPLAELNGKSLGTWGLAGAFSFFSNKVLTCAEGGLLVTDDDEVAARSRRLRSHAMSVGSWERHSGQRAHYDVAELGFNYRLDDPRSALLLSRLQRLPDDVAARQRLTRRYRAKLADVGNVIVPFSDAALLHASCYVMPIMLRDSAQRDAVRLALRLKHGVQTSVFYPPIHQFTAYRELLPDVRLPVTELAGACEITLPLFGHMTESQQDHVVEALATELGT